MTLPDGSQKGPDPSCRKHQTPLAGSRRVQTPQKGPDPSEGSRPQKVEEASRKLPARLRHG